MRSLRFLLAVTLLALAPPRAALTANVVFVEELDASGLGTFGVLGGAEVTAQLANGGLDVRVFPAQFVFIAQGGGPPTTPGIYDGVQNLTYHLPSESPLLGVFLFDDYNCGEFTGSYVVHEVALGADDSVLAFSADYTRHCADGSTRQGVIRFRAGDAACAGVPDGTSCDDRNACTSDDACASGGCFGIDRVSASCPAAEQCRRSAECNPGDGTCVAPPVPRTTPCDDGNSGTADDECSAGICAGCPRERGACETYVGRTSERECLYAAIATDGRPCDDGNPCTSGDICSAGACAGASTDCDDHDPCTDDACAAASGGCTSTPREGCWTITGATVARYAANGSIAGHRVACGYRCRTSQTAALLFEPENRFRIPSTPEPCPTGQDVRIPDLVGTVQTLRREQRLLVPDNLAAVEAAVRRCSGTSARLLGTRIALRPTADPARLDGKWTVRVRVPNVIPVYLTTVTHLFATLRTAQAPLTPSVPLRVSRLPACPSPVRLRCAVD